ncbi:DMT family transporter [Paenibacillus thailandensis]|jgi:quaternary ammonium compound-resistance protein SugE|uniref:DMT family transporter n=1 Tax=Paenibacillus thailandensis TaxID=393250 RepID=A0ABW5R3Y7_9BACL
MAWIYLLLAGALEVGWTFGLKYSEGFTKLGPSAATVILLIASFALFAKSMQVLEIGVAYAMFTGMGTVGTVIAGMILLDEPAEFWRLFFTFLLIVGIIGLKLVAGHDDSEKQSGGTEAAKSARAGAANGKGA